MRRFLALVAIALAPASIALAADPAPVPPDDLDCAVSTMTAMAGGVEKLKNPEMDADKRKETEKTVSRLHIALAHFVGKLEAESKEPGFQAEIGARYTASRVPDLRAQAARTVQCLVLADKALLDFLSNAKNK